MHFVVIGAGNMGCVYGANLARAGRQVSLVDVWVEHVQAHRDAGAAPGGAARKLHGPRAGNRRSGTGAQR